MINNLSKVGDDTAKTLMWLSASEAGFYPCGSRYFGYFTDESDYDFFFEKSDRTCDIIANFGFVCSSMPSNYMDVNTLSIWTKGKIHCIEVTSASSRMAIQDTLYGTEDRPPKDDRDWWNKKYCGMFPDLFTMPEIIEKPSRLDFLE